MNYRKKKARQTIWNPNWNNQRILEEHIFLWNKKHLEHLVTNEGPSFKLYKSQLSDGTPLKFKYYDSFEQFGNPQTNYIHYLELNLEL